jgi:hypothetical protein
MGGKNLALFSLLQLGQLDLTVSQDTVAKLSSWLVSEVNCCATTFKKIVLASTCTIFAGPNL